MKIMETEQIIKTLQEYNDLRRSRGKWDVDAFNEGESFFDSVTAHEIGVALDAAIERLQTLEKERDEAKRSQSYKETAKKIRMMQSHEITANIVKHLRL
jgi:hypothetical protein